MKTRGKFNRKLLLLGTEFSCQRRRRNSNSTVAVREVDGKAKNVSINVGYKGEDRVRTRDDLINFRGTQ